MLTARLGRSALLEFEEDIEKPHGPKNMSRPTLGAAPRNLTLTEELEKLEQSITLTLQEIDSNFSKAHRIVTTSILPIVDEYAKHSNDVWEGSKVCAKYTFHWDVH